MAIASLIIIAIGITLIGIGTYISLYEWKKEQDRLSHEQARKDGGIVTEAAGVVGETLDGLAKLAEALKHHRLGLQLIILGIALITIGGIFGGLGCLLSGCA